MGKLFVIISITVLFISACKKDVAIGQTSASLVNSSQILFNDWVPDVTTTASGTSILIDIDADGKKDIAAWAGKSYGGHTPSSGNYYDYSVGVSPLDTNVLISIGKPNILIKTQDVIDNNLWWFVNGCDLHCTYFGFPGYWTNSNSSYGYIGVKIKSSSGYRFGWIRLKASDQFSITMQECAFNTTYGQPILAGQTQ